MIWHLYIIKTVDNNLYTGITTDVERRFGEHCALGRKTAKYFHAHPPHTLLFSRAIGDRSLAQKVEYWFKKLRRSEKDEIVRRNELKFDMETGMVQKW